ncbi:MAG: hypothetical protein ACM31C_16755 [Acidobacteriota bacterium]
MLVLVLVLGGLANAQQAPSRLVVGIYAPSVEFGTAQSRLAYVQGLAKAIESATGIRTEAQSYATIAALKKDAVDFAIIEGQCIAVNPGWRLLAAANVGGGTSRTWALFSATSTTMQQLNGKKLAFVQTDCNDPGFIDNAMLESEVDATFFDRRVGEKDLTGAVADVASYKTAEAVFAPIDAARGLKKVFDTGSVPNPGFVQVSSRLPSSLADKVGAAVVGYGGSGAIAGWARPSLEPYRALAGRLVRATKSGVFASPEPVRIDAREVLVEPPTLRDTAYVPARVHFVRPPGARMN